MGHHTEPETPVFDDPQWPPGTMRLERILDNESTQIVLQPQPTTNPNDPLNWPKWRKHLNFGLAAFFALMSAAQINASTPTWGPMGKELNFDDEILNDTYAIGCATLAIGGFMMMPFALKYSLRPIYVLSCAAQLGVMIWGARTKTAGDWWGVNAVQCWLGSLGECMVQMTVSDVYFVHERGLVNAIYIWAFNFGGNLAPVAAGYVTTSMGWRWVWWWFVIIFGVETVFMIFGFEESKFDWTKSQLVSGVPAITSAADKTEALTEVDEKKAAPANMDSKGSGRSSPVQEPIAPVEARKSYLQRLALLTPTEGPWPLFLRHAYQPFLIMFSIPGVAYICMVYAILLSWGTVMSAAQSTYMTDAPYNFNSSQIGLMSLAPFIGNTLGTLIAGPVSDRLVLYLAKRNNGVYEPEMRLWILVVFIPFQVAGPFWFGHALQEGQSWVSVAFAQGVCQFGQAPISSAMLTYMLDAYNEIVGDALVALTFSRNTLSTVFVFAMTPWIKRVGMSNVFNTIGAIGVAVLMFAFVFIWRGKDWRHRTAGTYRHFAARQFASRPIKDYE